MNDDGKESGKGLPDLSKLISLKEAAQLSGFSYGHMRYLARNGDIGAKNWGETGLLPKRPSRITLLKNAGLDRSPRKGPRQIMKTVDNYLR